MSFGWMFWRKNKPEKNAIFGAEEKIEAGDDPSSGDGQGGKINDLPTKASTNKSYSWAYDRAQQRPFFRGEDPPQELNLLATQTESDDREAKRIVYEIAQAGMLVPMLIDETVEFKAEVKAWLSKLDREDCKKYFGMWLLFDDEIVPLLREANPRELFLYNYLANLMAS